MASNRVLEDGLKTIAADFRLPGGGRLKLSRLVAKHLDWFDAAELRGIGWRDMIRALASAGVTGPTGKQLSVGTLSSTVWRSRAKAEKNENEHLRRHPSSSSGKSARPAAPSAMLKMRKAPRTIGQPREPALPISKGSVAKPPSKKDDVLAFMDRARAVRQKLEKS